MTLLPRCRPQRTHVHLHELSLRPAVGNTPQDMGSPWRFPGGGWPRSGPAHHPHAAGFSLTRHGHIHRMGWDGGPRHDTYRACMPSRACVSAAPFLCALSFRWACTRARFRGAGTACVDPFLLGEAWWFAWVDAFTPLIFHGPPPSASMPPQQHHLDHRGE